MLIYVQKIKAPENQAMTEDNPVSEMADSYRLVNAGGNHYDIGRKMTDAFTPALHERLSRQPDGAILGNALKSVDAMFGAHPVLKDELQGIAEGISIEFEAVLCEVSDTFAPPSVSSTVISQTDGALLIGRNYASSPSSTVRNLLRLDPNDSYASLGRMGGYFAGTSESIGVYGVFACADILERNAAPVPGTAAYMIPRMISESARDISAALEKLRSIVPMHRSSYVIADASSAYYAVWDGSSFSVEQISKFPFLLKDGKKVNATPPLKDGESIKKYLSDHDGGACVHRPGAETIYSLLLGIGSERVEYTSGCPCRAPYATVDWPGGYG